LVFLFTFVTTLKWDIPKNNPLDFTVFLSITGYNLQFFEGDFLGDMA